MRRALLAALAVALLVPVPATAQRARFDTKVLAKVPPPGFPARAYVHPNGKVYEGTYVNPAGDNRPSKVFEFDGAGKLEREFSIPGQQQNDAHGIQVATSDARGRLVLLDRTPSRALILDPETAELTEYARFPDLPPPPGDDEDRPPFANYAAWAPDGALHVTDYVQGVIYRVPPGGGTPTVWLSAPELSGGMFGTAGIVLAPDRRTFLVTQGSGIGADPSTGGLLAVERRPDGSAAPPRTLWTSRPGDLPDGFALAASGKAYVALVGAPAQLAVLDPGGAELERFPPVPGSGENGSGVPFDSPSSAMFLGTRLIVANQSAVAGNPDHQVLLDVEAGEAGAPEIVPANAGPAEVRNPRAPDADAVLARVLRTGTLRRRGSAARRRATLRLSAGVRGAPARVRLTRRGRLLATVTVRGRIVRLTLRRGARPRGLVTLRLGRRAYAVRLR